MSTFIEKVEAETTKIKEAEKELAKIAGFDKCDFIGDKTAVVVLRGFKKGDANSAGVVETIEVFNGVVGEKNAARIIADVVRIHKNTIAEAKKDLRAICRKKKESK